MAHPIFTEDHDLIRAQLRRRRKGQPPGPKGEEGGFRAARGAEREGELASSPAHPDDCAARGLGARLGRVQGVGRSIMALASPCRPYRQATPHMCASAPARSRSTGCPGGKESYESRSPSRRRIPPFAGTAPRGARRNDYVLNGTCFIKNGGNGDLYFIANAAPGPRAPRALPVNVREWAPGFRGPRPRQDRLALLDRRRGVLEDGPAAG